jgi:hypothetical protein
MSLCGAKQLESKWGYLRLTKTHELASIGCAVPIDTSFALAADLQYPGGGTPLRR